MKDIYVMLATFLTQLLWFIQPIKKTEKRKNQAIDQLVFFLIYLKFMTEFFFT